jgi:organic hydroperoxide reductase OsmC/OhrA
MNADLGPLQSGAEPGVVASTANQTLHVRSHIAWLTGSPHGRASVGVGSRSFNAVPLSMSTVEPTPGETTPGELLAAAHGSALAVILARMLEDCGTPARELVVETTYELCGDWYEVGRIRFHVQVRLSDRGDPPLDQLAMDALDRCAQSLGLARDKVAMSFSRAV